MTTACEPPPLTPAETRVVLAKLGDLTERIVLIGGQALAFWAPILHVGSTSRKPSLPKSMVRQRSNPVCSGV